MLKLKIRPNLGFFAPQRRQNKPIQMKSGVCQRRPWVYSSRPILTWSVNRYDTRAPDYCKMGQVDFFSPRWRDIIYWLRWNLAWSSTPWVHSYLSHLAVIDEGWVQEPPNQWRIQDLQTGWPRSSAESASIEGLGLGRGYPLPNGGRVWRGGIAPSPENLSILSLKMATFSAFWALFLQFIVHSSIDCLKAF